MLKTPLFCYLNHNSCTFVTLINRWPPINHLINKATQILWILLWQLNLGRDGGIGGEWEWCFFSLEYMHGLAAGLLNGLQTPPAALTISETGITGDLKLLSSTLKALCPAPTHLSTSKMALKQWRHSSGPNEPPIALLSLTRPYCWCWICLLV